ncbi:MAG: hypothetical protein JJT81_16300 [Rubellimicrobium sp.]|nr:hypothetical protein [Rubellimicrobium sp.]
MAAIDGGGTKTAAAIADRTGRVTVLPELGGCNPQDNPGWADTLQSAIAAITARGAPSFTIAGLPGHGEVPDHDRAMERLVTGLLPQADVINDVAMAWHGAFAGAEGVLVLAGTGSMAMAAGPAGLHRVGGWGDLIGDEGSALWIGQEALRLCAQAWDGRRGAADRAFAEALSVRLSLVADHPFPFLDWLMQQPHPRIAMAGVARHVDALADAGDAVAQAILARAGEELVIQAQAVAGRAGLGRGFDWTSAGSVLRSRTVAQAVAQGLGRAPIQPRLDALRGGLWLAAERAGWAPGQAFRASLARGEGDDQSLAAARH